MICKGKKARRRRKFSKNQPNPVRNPPLLTTRSETRGGVLTRIRTDIFNILMLMRKLTFKGPFSDKHVYIEGYRSCMASFVNQFVHLVQIIEIQFFKCQKWIPHTILRRNNDPIFFSTFFFHRKKSTLKMKFIFIFVS